MFRSTLICLAVALAGLVSVVACATSAARHQPQGKIMHWTIDGVRREALVFAPRANYGSANHPLVLAFHGHGGQMLSTSVLMQIQTLWPEAIVVYPQGLNTPIRDRILERRRLQPAAVGGACKDARGDRRGRRPTRPLRGADLAAPLSGHSRTKRRGRTVRGPETDDPASPTGQPCVRARKPVRPALHVLPVAVRGQGLPPPGWARVPRLGVRRDRQVLQDASARGGPRVQQHARTRRTGGAEASAAGDSLRTLETKTATRKATSISASEASSSPCRPACTGGGSGRHAPAVLKPLSVIVPPFASTTGGEARHPHVRLGVRELPAQRRDHDLEFPPAEPAPFGDALWNQDVLRRRRRSRAVGEFTNAERSTPRSRITVASAGQGHDDPSQASLITPISNGA